MNLVNELKNKVIRLDELVEELAENGIAYAENNKEYRILLSQELLRLRTGKIPATVAYDVAMGKVSVAEAKFSAMKSEVIYKTTLEAINVIKIQIKVLQEQINKEWALK